MPSFRFNKALDIARDVKAFLNLEGGLTRGAVPAPERPGDQAENLENSQRRGPVRAEEIESKEQELRRKRKEFRKIRDAERAAKDGPLGIVHKRRKKNVDLEIFRLERELMAAREGWPEDGAVTGALPDFLVIGTMKGGTTFLYHLLSQHPLVEPAASKEIHFFDALYEEGADWYRNCFPTPRQKDGRTTITGEATPYMSNRHSPERVSEMVPQARLIALLRNPVDRAYSHYQQMVRRGGEKQTFEEAVEAEIAASRPPDTTGDGNRAGSRPGPSRSRSSYLSRGVYVEQLVRWAEHFDEEQTLVLKSEDFFGSPVDTLEVVLGFLGLPEWEPEPSEPRGKNSDERKKFKGKYKREMDPETRRRLEEYFEPHNRRLYDYLGVDFGW
ncbi:MAG: sulfotransferase domain-containing protein [Rubrobacter sp.]|nr:sulfotransferase domain-containing protein [Rubrobacter sp.]